MIITACLPQARGTCVGAAPEGAARIPFQATQWGVRYVPRFSQCQRCLPAVSRREASGYWGGTGRRQGWSNRPRGMMAAQLFSITRKAACCRDHLSTGKLPGRLARPNKGLSSGRLSACERPRPANGHALMQSAIRPALS